MVWHGVHLATIARQISVLEAYHETDPTLLDRRDDAYGMSPLIWACGACGLAGGCMHAHVVGRISSSMKPCSTHAHMLLTVMGHEEVAAWLLDHGASIELADHGARSSLFYSAKMGNDSLVEMLLGRGACACLRFFRLLAVIVFQPLHTFTATFSSPSFSFPIPTTMAHRHDAAVRGGDDSAHHCGGVRPRGRVQGVARTPRF